MVCLVMLVSGAEFRSSSGVGCEGLLDEQGMGKDRLEVGGDV